MKSSLTADKISYDDVQTTVQRYEGHVPPKISGLDKLRLEEVPSVLAQRKDDGEAFLEKTEVASLVEWKLYVIEHYTYTRIRLLTTRELQETWHIPTQPCKACL